MATRALQDRFMPVRRTALHGMLVALPLSAAMWAAIVGVVEIFR